MIENLEITLISRGIMPLVQSLVLALPPLRVANSVLAKLRQLATIRALFSQPLRAHLPRLSDHHPVHQVVLWFLPDLRRPRSRLPSRI
jgi:hypothetical protein